MRLALEILLVLFCVQALAKCVMHFLVPYEKRIRQMARNYAKDHKAIAIYDDVTLLVVVGMVALLFATEAHGISFLTGLFVGMSVIQVFFHRFARPLPEDKMPEGPLLPIKHMSYAIQAQPGLAWREYLLSAVASIWGLYLVLVAA